MSYQHLTIEQRSQIYALKSNNHSQKDIAAHIGVHKSTMSRELKRNSGNRGYRYKQAHEMATARRSSASTAFKKWAPELEKRVENGLKEQHSPEQISGRLKLIDINISHERIYQYIHDNKVAGGYLYKELRHRGKKYNYKRGAKHAGRGCIPNRVDISKRPKVVEGKRRLGDWEGDTLIGKNHKGAILSMVDRKSKFTLLSLLKKKGASDVVSATKRCFNRAPRKICRTITYDNGKEFSAHDIISKALNMKCFFARPYCSWERGLNEHTNGLVRQYLPKKTDFTVLTDGVILEIENKLNDRPRKVLGYLTPREVYLGKSRAAKVALGG
jgi:IS30 family transposase